MSRSHPVELGDSIPSIAARVGHLPDTLWSHPDNAELRQRRGNMHVLCPDVDVVQIPDVEPRHETIPIDTTTVFRRKAVPTMLRVVLHDHDNAPLATDYLIEIDGELRSGRTAATGAKAGLVEQAVAPALRSAALRWKDDEGRELRARLEVSRLLPFDHPAGVQQRLINLGYYRGRVDAELGEHSREALRRFQADHGIEPTAEPSEATLDELKKAYGA